MQDGELFKLLCNINYALIHVLSAVQALCRSLQQFGSSGRFWGHRRSRLRIA